MYWLKKIDENFEEYLVIFFLTIMTIATLAQVFFRFVIEASLDWSEELARYAFLWCMFVATGMAVKRKRHIRVEFGLIWLSKPIRNSIEIVADIIWLIFCIILVKDGIELLGYVKTQVSPSLEIPYLYVYSSLPVGAALMVIRLLQQFYRRFKHGDNANSPAEREA
jgi:TRAP-type C4-dicarboxylate transport system permease small subunit